jgi:antitoxin component YwqK of YwqJK toxin-antitoxin module
MKTLTLLLLSIILFNYSAHTQDKDSIQPDSLYRKYNIHYRTSHEGSSTKSNDIFVFDRSGKYAAFILTDNETGKIPQLVMAYEYNAKNQLSAEHDTSFFSGTADIKNAKLTYSDNGELTKKSILKNGHIVSEIAYFPAEKRETESLYRSGKIYREQTTYYDEHNKKIRFTGTEKGDADAKPRIIEVNGRKFTIPAANKDERWDYIFKNSYDSLGNLVGQKRLVDNAVQDEAVFLYDSRGLLISKKQSNHSDPVVFEYKSY